jgi:hypothetical protein
MGRPKLDQERTNNYKVTKGTSAKLEKLAISLGYKYGKGAAMGKFLDVVADLDPDLLKIIIQKSNIINQNQALLIVD